MVGVVLSATLGYLLGSVPTGVLVCRLVGGRDVRQHGSGHTGGLNVSRTAGLAAGILTGIVDALLGAAAVAVTLALTENLWAAAAAGVMAVVGHNWSILIRFGGGIGISSLAGAMLCLEPRRSLVTAAILLALWLLLVSPLGFHRARATIVVMMLVGPLIWGIGGAELMPQSLLLGVFGGAIVAAKTIPDWSRQYD